MYAGYEEQLKRLKARLDDPTKRWKFNVQDLKERKRWDDYQEAYEAVLADGITEWAPWHIIPANVKWYRNLLVSELLLATLERMDPQFPPAAPDLDSIVLE